jgi:hypothetical protein
MRQVIDTSGYCQLWDVGRRPSAQAHLLPRQVDVDYNASLMIGNIIQFRTLPYQPTPESNGVFNKLLINRTNMADDNERRTQVSGRH